MGRQRLGTRSASPGRGRTTHFEGEYRIRAEPERVYGLFVDTPRVVAMLPEVEVLDLRPEDAGTVRGRVRTGVSFLKGTFNVVARIVERDPPRRAKMAVTAQGMGSTIDVRASVVLSPAEAGTSVSWDADVAIRGTVATIGARLLPGLVEDKTKAFLEALRRELES